MKKYLWTICFIALLVLSGCNNVEEERRGCKPPPDSFTEADLVGTWWAGYVSSPKRDDFLIIREYGLYKQIIHLEAYSIEYESIGCHGGSSISMMVFLTSIWKIYACVHIIQT